MQAVWFAVGLGTVIAGVIAVYWGEIKKKFKRSEGMVGQQEIPKLNISVEQVVAGALAWIGCKRYTYLCPDGEQGVIWARSDEAATLILERHGCSSPLLRRTKWETPKEGDLVVYDEEVYAHETR